MTVPVETRALGPLDARRGVTERPRSQLRPRISPSAVVRTSAWGELIVLREHPPPGGRRLAPELWRTEPVARAFRGAMLHHAIDPPPPVLSGHGPDGERLRGAHVAYLALPGTGPAAGRIDALALAIPRALGADERAALLLAAHRWQASGFRLLLGRIGAMDLRRMEPGSSAAEEAEAAWVGPATDWESVTPVALDRNPGDLFSRDASRAARATLEAERIVSEACAHSGLPRPAEVRILFRPPNPSTPPAARFMPFPRVGSGLKRVCVHVALRFKEPVTGPVLLGVGRYFGVGVLQAASATGLAGNGCRERSAVIAPDARDARAPTPEDGRIIEELTAAVPTSAAKTGDAMAQCGQRPPLATRGRRRAERAAPAKGIGEKPSGGDGGGYGV